MYTYMYVLYVYYVYMYVLYVYYVYMYVLNVYYVWCGCFHFSQLSTEQSRKSLRDGRTVP